MTYKMTTTYHALRAVELRQLCGRYAASRYAAKHGVSSLYRLALQLSAVSSFSNR